SITIPRLELTAATLAVRVDAMLKRELEIPISRTLFWTDSTAVLRYVLNETSRFHTFVANRLTVIHEGSDVSQWKYVNTKLNPADYASRGLSAEALVQKKQWICAPDFLWQSETEWPTMPTQLLGEVSGDDPEVKQSVPASVFATGSSVTDLGTETEIVNKLINYHSSWFRLKRSVAWILKVKSELLRRVRNKSDKVVSDSDQSVETCKAWVTITEMRQAEKLILRVVQHQAFKLEFDDLECNKRVKSSSHLRRLAPVIIDGLLCVGGRLNRANLPVGFRNPVILSKNHHVSELILSEIHLLVLHSGRNHMLSDLRQKYWLIHAPSAIRKLIAKCIPCRRRRASVCEQKMSDLPQDRLVPDEPPFTSVGCDYFGPFHVKQRRSRVKRYGVMFTCLTSRAIHIEVSETLDTDSYINSL
ncbi:MAG: hypothetical protein MJA29_10925, partial [Candidatus Omnitrophica bacterium]|nr:hypothetical protein [Candidatus Omnitrophota bacterium]